MRLFVAVPLPEDVRQRLADVGTGLRGARWVDVDHMHITLRFIGEVDAGVAEDIHHALDRIRAPAFAITVNGLGCFGNGRRVRTLWAGIERQDRLLHLREKVESAVVRTGLEPERRKFKAHVTLARFKDGAPGPVGAFIEAQNDLRAGPVDVDSFTLFESRLGSAGPHYEALAQYPLTA